MVDPSFDGRRRVVIAHLSPEIDCGRFAIKRVVGEAVTVEADVFSDSHDRVACQILYSQDGSALQTAPMKPLGNDRWRGQFLVYGLGEYRYTVEGWIDRFQTWRVDLEKRISAEQDISVDLLIGVDLIQQAATRATGDDAKSLENWALRLRQNHRAESGAAIALDLKLFDLIQRYPEREQATRYDKLLPVIVEREKARF